MRWIRDLAGVVLIASLALGVYKLYLLGQSRETLEARLGEDVRRLEKEIRFRAATGKVELNARGWPLTIDPNWWDKGQAPQNWLLDKGRAWVEVASVDQAGLLHPPVRLAVDSSQAAFWYNPNQGVVRARVPVMVSDEQALELYNRINGTGLGSIFAVETPIPLPDPNNGLPEEPKGDMELLDLDPTKPRSVRGENMVWRLMSCDSLCSRGPIDGCG